jgi:hypothetical protein
LIGRQAAVSDNPVFPVRCRFAFCQIDVSLWLHHMGGREKVVVGQTGFRRFFLHLARNFLRRPWRFSKTQRTQSPEKTDEIS